MSHRQHTAAAFNVYINNPVLNVASEIAKFQLLINYTVDQKNDPLFILL